MEGTVFFRVTLPERSLEVYVIPVVPGAGFIAKDIRKDHVTVGLLPDGRVGSIRVAEAQRLGITFRRAMKAAAKNSEPSPRDVMQIVKACAELAQKVVNLYYRDQVVNMFSGGQPVVKTERLDLATV